MKRLLSLGLCCASHVIAGPATRPTIPRLTARPSLNTAATGRTAHDAAAGLAFADPLIPLFIALSSFSILKRSWVLSTRTSIHDQRRTATHQYKFISRRHLRPRYVCWQLQEILQVRFLGCNELLAIGSNFVASF